jgi:DnaJ family protein C protein 17
MPVEDLLEIAKSGTDFYALLGEGLHPGSTDNDIKRAYRRTALKHHPDKHPDDPNAPARFHSLQVAYDVLSDPEARAAYDAARAARERKKHEADRLDGRRKAFADELLKAERGEGDLKRKREENVFQTELERIAADGARRRQARSEAMRKEAEKDRQQQEEIAREGERVEQEKGGLNVPEISRTVKIRFSREGAGADFDEERIRTLFDRFGAIANVMMLKDRKIRPAEGEKKRNMGTAAVVYSSIVDAHASVEDYRKQTGAEWALVDKVDWAEGQEPAFLRTSTATTSQTSAMPTPSKAPAFSSFKAPAATGPSFEEMTFMRLKKAEQRKAEKRKLEEQMRREEADATNTTEIPAS